MTGTRPEPAEPLVRVGDIVRVPEAHYLYGAGTLTMRVTGIDADLVRHPALEWIRLVGVGIRHDGAEGGVRDVMVRVAALHDPGAVTRR